MSRSIVVLGLVLVMVLAVCSSVLADYQLSDGSTVHWAGGDNIVVTDKDGNVTYSGPGDRTKDSQGNDRLLPPDLSSGGRDYVLNETTPTTVGLGGAALPVEQPGISSGGGSSVSVYQGSDPTNPYADLLGSDYHYTGMQRLELALADGRTVSGYVNVYENWDPALTGGATTNPYGGGRSAVPAESEIGKTLASAGFQVKDGWVLVDYNVPQGVNTGWERAGTVGPSGEYVSGGPVNQIPGHEQHGGTVIIDLTGVTLADRGGSGHSSGSGSSGYAAPSSGAAPVVDMRALTAYPEQSVVKVGKVVPLVAEVTGACRQVLASTGWGGSAVLLPGPDGKFRGVLQVSVNVRPGVYPLVFEAVIGQQGYADLLFSARAVLTVQALASGGQEAPRAPGEEPDWWTPPQYQSP